jgi:hypothetical protein
MSLLIATLMQSSLINALEYPLKFEYHEKNNYSNEKQGKYKKEIAGCGRYNP